MIIPVRCTTCGKVVAGLYNTYKQRVAGGENSAKVMDDLGLERYCCRALFLTHVDMLSRVAKYRV
ncbi:MAG: DNA-directed RNA polymerase subunit N [Candidatus Aenigmarchaeota archaeon]|nr:DNA-directed RNA polymerase subunit N [Candidatus Aenigmarchaeota archaeon]